MINPHLDLMARQTSYIVALILAWSFYLPALANPLADGHWRTLEGLNGSWRISAPRTDAEKPFRINFRPISKGSALVETFGDPAKQITETIYHRDGERIMATHYCARGNQPRLLLDPSSTRAALSFTFLDITNLKNKADPHMVRMDFKIIDANHIEIRETYAVNGELKESAMRLEREIALPATTD